MTANGTDDATASSTPPVARCDRDLHDWEPAGTCTHGPTVISAPQKFNAYRCIVCGVGAHARIGRAESGQARESLTERTQRIERQIAACPVWDALIPEAQAALRV